MNSFMHQNYGIAKLQCEIHKHELSAIIALNKALFQKTKKSDFFYIFLHKTYIVGTH